MIPTRGPNALACNFDLTNLCESAEENKGALMGLLGLKQAIALAYPEKILPDSDNRELMEVVSEYIKWARTGIRPAWFSNEIL